MLFYLVADVGEMQNLNCAWIWIAPRLKLNLYDKNIPFQGTN